MLCAPAAPALNAVKPRYVGMNTVRRPKVSENGPHLHNVSSIEVIDAHRYSHNRSNSKP